MMSSYGSSKEYKFIRTITHSLRMSESESNICNGFNCMNVHKIRIILLHLTVEII